MDFLRDETGFLVDRDGVSTSASLVVIMQTVQASYLSIPTSDIFNSFPLTGDIASVSFDVTNVYPSWTLPVFFFSFVTHSYNFY